MKSSKRPSISQTSVSSAVATPVSSTALQVSAKKQITTAQVSYAVKCATITLRDSKVATIEEPSVSASSNHSIRHVPGISSANSDIENAENFTRVTYRRKNVNKPIVGALEVKNNINIKQLHKEYGEITKQENCPSSSTESPFPSTRSFIEKRRAVLTCSEPRTTFTKKKEFIKSYDEDIVDIFGQGRKSMSIIDNDPDLGVLTDSKIRPKKADVDNQSTDCSSNIIWTDLYIDNCSKENSSPNTANTKDTPKIKSRTSNVRPHKCDRGDSSGDESLYRRRTISVNNISSNDLIDTYTDTSFEMTPVLEKTKFVVVRRPIYTDVLEKNIAVSTSDLVDGRISSSENMFKLPISSDRNKYSSFNSSDTSFSPIQSNVMKSILQIVNTSEQSIDDVIVKPKEKINDKYDNNHDSASKEMKVISTENNYKEIYHDDLNSVNKTTNEKKCPSPSLEKTMNNSSENYNEHTHKTKVDNKEISGKTYCSSSCDDTNIMKNRIVRKLYDPSNCFQESSIFRDDQDRERTNQNSRKRLTLDLIKPGIDFTLSLRAKEFVNKRKIKVGKVFEEYNGMSCDHKPQQELLEKGETENKYKKRYVYKENEPERRIVTEKDRQVECDKIISRYSLNIPRKNYFERKTIAPENGNSSSKYKTTANHRELKSHVVKRQCTSTSEHLRKVNSDTTLSETKIIPSALGIRQSITEFDTGDKFKKEKFRKVKWKKPSIVCTKMHRDEIQIVSQIVRKLGGFCIEDEVSRKTTHLVAGEPKRTINMLRAIAIGCWIVEREWLYRSLDSAKWLPEEDFELTNFSPAVEQCRLQRQAFGASYSMDIFKDCGSIFIAKGSTPRCSDLRELVILSKGKCTTNVRNAEIVVGESLDDNEIISVSEKWILDSITFNKRMPLKNYIISANGTGVNV
ncbi:hypothetical protein JTB14_024637 [Gonioctena quinquepunctata]|nr:hypothetical protein JTB14_024637 [Gonioctena quinquepunctata]